MLRAIADTSGKYPLNNPGRRRSQTAYELAQRKSAALVAFTF